MKQRISQHWCPSLGNITTIIRWWQSLYSLFMWYVTVFIGHSVARLINIITTAYCLLKYFIFSWCDWRMFEVISLLVRFIVSHIPDSKVHGANMGPTWVLSAPDGPHEPCSLGWLPEVSKYLGLCNGTRDLHWRQTVAHRICFSYLNKKIIYMNIQECSNKTCK